MQKTAATKSQTNFGFITFGRTMLASLTFFEKCHPTVFTVAEPRKLFDVSDYAVLPPTLDKVDSTYCK